MGVREDPWALRLDWTLMVLEQGVGRASRRGVKVAAGLYVVSCVGIADPNLTWAESACQWRSGGECQEMNSVVPLWSGWCVMHSEQASYSAPSRSSQQLACCLHLFLCHVWETNKSRRVKRWLPVLQSNAVIHSCFPATCQPDLWKQERARGTGAIEAGIPAGFVL